MLKSSATRYVIVVLDYCGSAGFGQEYWELIDYGGLEVEDVYAGRQFRIEALRDLIDPKRVGIRVWSNGVLSPS